MYLLDVRFLESYALSNIPKKIIIVCLRNTCKFYLLVEFLAYSTIYLKSLYQNLN